MKQLTNIQAAYIAGIFDTEGNIGGTKSLDSSSFVVDVCVTNTNLKLLNLLKDITGLGNIHKKVEKENWKQGYFWRLKIEESKKLLPIIEYYSIIKEDQIHWILEYINGRKALNQYDQLTYDEKCEREFIYQKLNELNKRGPKNIKDEIDNISYIKINKLSEEQKSYIAACLDGDGSIHITKNKNCFYTTCNIYNNEIKLMNWLRKTIGLGTIHLHRKENEKHENSYTFYLNRNGTKYLLPQLLPYSIIKKDQIELGLELVNERKACRMNPLTYEEKLKREALYELVKELNKRGI